MVGPGRSHSNWITRWIAWFAVRRPQQWTSLLLRIAAISMTVIFFAPVQAAARQNVERVWSSEAPLGGYHLGDFDGDGRTDLFRVVGNQWQYSSAGTGPWQNLGSDPTPITELRFGDFNGDGRTDVFSRAPDGRWRYSDAGQSNWINIASDATPLNDLRFGDFNGDGRTDVFSVSSNGRWRYSDAGQSGWIDLAMDNLTVNDLRFGYFDGDSRMDVFSRAADGHWRYSSGGTGNYQPLASDPAPLHELAIGDFNGDGISDVFHRTASGQWRYSPSGTGGWINLASDPLPLSELRFGDFNGDNITDVFSIGPGGIPRYSPGGSAPWVNLNAEPPTPQPPTTVPSTPINQLRFGDFDGDGRADVFRSDGGQWQFSSGGTGPWQNLAFDSTPLSELRFGDFNGDRRTDVFSRAPDGRWRYSDGGRSQWISLSADPLPLSELRFGDFNGDGRTDVFSRTPEGQWRYSDAGQSGWINLASDPLPLSELRFGDFNGDRRTDVFSRAPDGRWRYSDAGLSPWVNIGSDPLPLNELRFGDFNGDRRTDVFSRAPDGRWRYSDAGQSGWINLASDSLPLDELRFEDFDGDGRTDVFSIGPDGRWRYSSAGQSGWILLGPPSSVTPSPTLTPTPTGSPTGQPPGPSCPNHLDNGGFESSSGWEFGKSPIVGKYTGAQHRNGIRSVQLGNPPDSGQANVVSYSSVRQKVTVPANAATVTLHWWSLARSEEGSASEPSASQDRQEVILLSPGGETLRILQRVRHSEGSWRSQSIDLTEYAGKSFYIYFNVYNDGSGGRTWMYLDDVVLEVCGGQGYGGQGHDGRSPGGYSPGGYTPGGYPPPYDRGRGPYYDYGTPCCSDDPYQGRGDGDRYDDDRRYDYGGDDDRSYDYGGDDGGYDGGYDYGGDPYDDYDEHSGDPYAGAHCGPSKGDYDPCEAEPWPTDTPVPTMTPIATATVTITPTATMTDTTNGEPITDSVGMTLSAAPQAAPLMPVSTPAAPAEQGGCVELINNGDFEASDTGWSILDGPAAANYATEITFNGSGQSMRLGITEGENRSSISAIDQIVSLPSGATSIVLSFRYYPLHESPPGPGDLQYVDIYNAATGQFAGRALGVQANDRTWLTTDYDITALAGQTIRLVIAVNNDGVDGRSAMYVDNVSITACNVANLVSPAVTGTPTTPGISADPDETGSATRRENQEAPQHLAGRNNDPALTSQSLLTRLGAIGVMAGVLGAIGFAAFVIIGTLREPD